MAFSTSIRNYLVALLLHSRAWGKESKHRSNLPQQTGDVGSSTGYVMHANTAKTHAMDALHEAAARHAVLVIIGTVVRVVGLGLG